MIVDLRPGLVEALLLVFLAGSPAQFESSRLVAPGHRPHKAGVPALALLLPTLLAPYLPPELLELVKDPAILGALTVFWHQFTSGVGKAGNQGVDSPDMGG